MRNPHRNRGDIAIGAMLMVIGVVLLLGRANIVQWGDRFTLWPVILLGIGVARLLQSPPGGPRQGLLFLVAGAWLFAAEAGVMSLYATWPFLIIAFGLTIALNGGIGRRAAAVEPGSGVTGTDVTDKPKKHPRVTAMTGLAVLGIWIAVAVAVKTSGVGFTFADGRSDINVAAVMGHSEHASRATDFRRASVTTIMGKAELDLRAARIAPGGEAVVDVFGFMGTPVIRVPDGWVVDVSALPVMGGVKDQRFTPPAQAESEKSEPAPRLVLRGVVVMGAIVITS